MNRYLISLGLEDDSLKANEITYTICLENFIFFSSNIIALNITLDSALLILNIKECRFSHDSLAHDTTGNRYLLIFKSIIVVLDILTVSSYIVCLLHKWISSHLTQFLQLLSSDLSLLTYFFCCKLRLFMLRSLYVVVTHCDS